MCRVADWANPPRMAPELSPHPLRNRVLGELHARPFIPTASPARVLHYGFITDEAAATADRAALAAYCEGLALEGPAPGARHHRVAFSGASLRWEHHTEFTTYTWEAAEARRPEDITPFEPSADGLAGLMRLLPQPGPLLVAIDLHLLPAGDPPLGPETAFGHGHVAVAETGDGLALMATDFRPDARGFVRILALDRGLRPDQAGALVQRLLEVETYRTLALLGLPEAQALDPAIRRIEGELPRVLGEMQLSAGFEANKALLGRITVLAAELETGAARGLFRFGATRAYDELVRLRLDAAGERAVPGYPSWSAFLSRRLNPAIRTCASTEERQANLSRKLARAAQLLRTRVDVELESQNRDLLRAMNERAQVQLRLQQTVEGLSIAAITYYVASLAHLALEGAHAGGLPLDPEVGTALVLPFILGAVAFVVARIRRSHHA